MDDTKNRILVVGQINGDTLRGLEQNSRRVLLANEMSDLANLASELGTEAQVAVEAREQNQGLDKKAATERFWHNLVPGRRTAPPAGRHFQPRYGTIQTRQKLKRSTRQRDLAAKAERRSLRGWIKQYLNGQISREKLYELAGRIGATEQLQRDEARLAIRKAFV